MKPTASTPAPPRPLTVLLIDDQPIVGEMVRRMLAGETDITLHYESDPARALARAEQVRPTVILQDLVMPAVDGITLARQIRTHPATSEIPLIVLSSKEEPKTKAEAFANGASDYLVKLPDRIELIARIRHHSRGYLNLIERNEAFAALQRTQEALNRELAEAALYVRGILPPPLSGRVTTAWEFISSSSLGGDSFGHHWLDEDTLAIYLLDVCGHGVGAALLAVSVVNVLRSQSLPRIDFRDPVSVLCGLNAAFPMERHNNMNFTCWYGVYHAPTRTLRFGSGGHPPAVLIKAGGQPRELLRTPGLSIGSLEDARYLSNQTTVPPDSLLYIFSDGVYEITKPDESLYQLEEFIGLLSTPLADGPADVQRLLDVARRVGKTDIFDDDYSLLRLHFT